MAALALTLLGRPQIDVDGQPVELKSQKALALFFYLGMTRQIHSRQSLAGLFWSDLDEAAARRNLRVELHKLRGALEPFVDAGRETIGLDRNGDYLVDVERFERCLHGHEPSFAELQEAVVLYRGDFLADFHVSEAPLFEEWVTTERERLRQMARQALLRLVEHYILQREYDRGIECVSQLLKREPWLEEAHQQMMRLLALNGQRSAALAHYELASRILDDEFGVPPADETNALYDQIESGAFEGDATPLAPRAPAPPPPPVPRTPPFQAPAPQLHFVGRSHELATLQQQLVATKSNQTVALVGMAGVGKTTLAAQLAHDLRAHFADGVLWAYTASSDPLDILGSWAQALGYDFSSLSDVENRAAALRGVLVDKQLLFVLDDVRSVARARALFVGGTNSATLLTTRDLDSAAAFHAYAYPLAEMTPQDGEQLLRRILGEERVEAEVAAARQICALLQQLPLAVEIAAQRLRSRPRRRLVDMAERLQDMQERLDLAISDRAVRTSFTVSWESLDQEQQRVFALLGLFGGRSFAAPALAYIAELDLYTTEDRLFTLTALSLLNEEEAEDEQPLRYRQHPLLADFASERLGEEYAAQLRLVHYYLAFAREQQTDYAALQPEWENLIAGLQTAYALEEWQSVLDYADALTGPWFTRARYTEAREAYALVKAAAEALGDEQTLAECLLRWGRACIEQNSYDEAKALLDQSLSLVQLGNNTSKTAAIKYELARIAIEQSQYALAKQLLVECESEQRALGDTLGIAATIYSIAFVASHQGDYSYAQILQDKILTVQEVDDKLGAIRTLRLLIDIALANSNYQEAEQNCQRALKICHELQNQAELAATLYSSAVIHRRLGNLLQAQDFVSQSIQLLKRMGDHKFYGLALYELSVVKEALKEYDAALAIAQESLSIAENFSDIYNLVYFLVHLGDLYQYFKQFEEAKSFWLRALELARLQSHPMTERLQTLINSSP